MRYLQHHIITIVHSYNGSMPLSHFLKNHFRQNPKLGSRDRKILTAMAYGWYRIGKTAGSSLSDTAAQWLSNPTELLHDLPVAIQALSAASSFDINKLFPYEVSLSAGITKEEWLKSMLIQPSLFIRIRKEKNKITRLLDEHKIPFSFITDTCLSLPNGAKIDALLPPDGYVVQDASSQQTGTFFSPQKNEHWYDCCSGAGGKSLLLKDMEPSVLLSVSDIRDSIIHNLQQRFKLYGHKSPLAYITNVADGEQLKLSLGSNVFDNIICDVPCSGSGTWARTPEQLYFFDPAHLAKFPPLQQSIAVNVSRFLKPGGRLIYITCSVFRHENEDVVNAVIKETGLKPMRHQVINGTGLHADSMFISILQKE